MRYKWCSPTHNWCLVDVREGPEVVAVEIWRGLSTAAQSQKYRLKFFTGDLPERTDEELFEKGFRLALGEFNERTTFDTSIVELADDGSVNAWRLPLPPPEPLA